jgi:dTDP-4-dehydrorhamnose reductase
VVATLKDYEINMWLIVGANGQLGRSLADVLNSTNQKFFAASRTDFDVIDSTEVNDFFQDHRFTTVVNCAAWTAVDDAEDHIADALRANFEGPKNLATASLASQARLIHISTDYVFPGDASEPYEVNTPPDPLNAYGRTKQMGDSIVLHIGSGQFPVIRTAWLYSKYGRNFAKTMVRQALQNNPVNVVNDQLGQPTLATDLARLIVEVAQHPQPPSIIHGTNAGKASWFDFAQLIYQSLEVDIDLVTPVSTETFPTKAARPKYSVLGHESFKKNGLTEMRDWKIALSSEIEDIRTEVRNEM